MHTYSLQIGASNRVWSHYSSTEIVLRPALQQLEGDALSCLNSAALLTPQGSSRAPSQTPVVHVPSCTWAQVSFSIHASKQIDAADCY